MDHETTSTLSSPAAAGADAPLYALIMAGGSGQRFWPLSRNQRPKQLIPLLPGGPLLRQTVDRLRGLVAPERILVLTNADQVAPVREMLPELPAGHVLAEPARRDTGAAVALGAAWVAAMAPDAVMLTLPADHHIPDVEAFQRVIRAGVAAACGHGDLVTLGVQPSWACPGYGYIERGDPVAAMGGAGEAPVYQVAAFREKPDRQLAEWFVSQGRFVWNAGIFIWSVAAVRRELAAHAPELAGFIDRMLAQAPASFSAEAIRAAGFEALSPLSIDYALMEKSARVLNLTAAFEWDDVGSWLSAARHLPADAEGNRSNAGIFTLDAASNVVFSDAEPQVALLGVRDLIVVQTRDALLVASQSRAEDIKQLVRQLPPGLR